MRILYFTHSLRACWNHGNAHFLRGVLNQLRKLGHDVEALEPRDAWSAQNLVRDHGPAALDGWREAYPELKVGIYDDAVDLERLTEGADLVIAHEWNDPELIAELGRLRAGGAGFTLFFHDTHHRAVSAPHEMERYELDGYDGVLAFGEALAEVYRARGWGRRVFVWHEAADTDWFKPPQTETEREGLVWIGNWGDGERTAEIERFLLRPAARAGLPLEVFGVRYPPEALRLLAAYDARWRGWAPNVQAPAIYARRLATAHVPRRFYVEALPGIPTIRVFEALACGIPLVSAPWDDAENLFEPGEDYLTAADGEEAARCFARLAADPDLRAALAASGLERVRARHTCAHRARELLDAAASLDGPTRPARDAAPAERLSA